MKGIIYARQSKDRDGDGTAIDRQLDQCRLLAAARELEIVEEITENDTSATKGSRPGFGRVLKMLEGGEISAVVVWHTDRLYRRVSDLVRLMEIAEKKDVWLMTVRGGDLDLSTASGRMFANMTASVARYEVEHKGERQVDANRQRADRGVWQFSRRPYGYQRVNGEVQIIEAEAEVLREAYRRYLAGESYYSIVEDFNARGIATTTDRPWSITTLRERLRNPAYAGFVVYQGKVVGDGNWTPVIDRDTWTQYTRMRSRRKVPHDWANAAKHLLSGLAVCGVCGGAMLARPEYRTRKGVRVVTYAYSCQTNWCVSRNMKRLDDLVERIIIARFSLPDVLELMKVDESTVDLEAQAVDIRARWDGLAELVAEGTLRPQAVRDRAAEFRVKLDRIEAQIAEIRDRSTIADLAGAENVAERWHALPLPRRRSLIQSQLSIVVHKQSNPRVFDPEDVAVTWRS